MKAHPRRSINVYGVARVSGDTTKQRGVRLVKNAHITAFLRMQHSPPFGSNPY